MRERKKCLHGFIDNGYFCRDCGGKGICEHKRRRHQCKECDGSFCEHKRRKDRCKDCKALGIGGQSLCEHNRQHSVCKECNGIGICEHNKVRCRCKDCGGSQICEHQRARATCRECGGSQICEHGRQRRMCKECGGSSICPHGTQNRYYCRKCKDEGIGGAGFCEHDRVRKTCRECGGTNFCQHTRDRRRCLVCRPETVYKQYERNAANTKRSFTLTFEQFITVVSLPCLYCGENNEQRGVDRWDNNVGYVFENCRPCCPPCNYFKGSKDGPTFVDHIRRMADHTRAVENADSYATFEATQQ
jgi:hypothetical protein